MIFNQPTANKYDSWYATPKGAFIDKVESDAAFSLFKPEPGLRVLDAGCGTGNYSIKLTNLGCKVTGIDLSSAMLEIAREKAAQLNLDIDFHCMDMTRLSFADNSFDAVFSMTAWEFIADSQQGFAELMRVVKPGGQLLIGMINSDSSWGEMYRERAQKEQNSVFHFAYTKKAQDLYTLNEDLLAGTADCLFVPPSAADQLYNPQEEAASRARGERPGFVVALWRKPQAG